MGVLTFVLLIIGILFLIFSAYVKSKVKKSTELKAAPEVKAMPNPMYDEMLSNSIKKELLISQFKEIEEQYNQSIAEINAKYKILENPNDELYNDLYQRINNEEVELEMLIRFPDRIEELRTNYLYSIKNATYVHNYLMSFAGLISYIKALHIGQMSGSINANSLIAPILITAWAQFNNGLLDTLTNAIKREENSIRKLKTQKGKNNRVPYLKEVFKPFKDIMNAEDFNTQIKAFELRHDIIIYND